MILYAVWLWMLGKGSPCQTAPNLLAPCLQHPAQGKVDEMASTDPDGLFGLTGTQYQGQVGKQLHVLEPALAGAHMLQCCMLRLTGPVHGKANPCFPSVCAVCLHTQCPLCVCVCVPVHAMS